MVSLIKCKKILENNGKGIYNDNEVKLIREHLYQLAELEVKKFIALNENKKNYESN